MSAKRNVEYGFWNRRNEETAREWGRSAIILKWLHYQVAMYYQRIDKYLGIPAFFFTSAIGTSLVGAALTENSDVAMILTWICAGISFVTSGLIGVLFYLDPGTLSQRHLNKSVHFDDIYHDIQLELSMSNNLRQDPGWFLQFVQRKIALAQKQPPVIPKRFWEQKAIDIVNGHLAHDLREMEQYMNDTFGKNGRPDDITPLHEELRNAKEYEKEIRTFARKETLSFAEKHEPETEKPGPDTGKHGQVGNGDVLLEMEEVHHDHANNSASDYSKDDEESNDYINGMILQEKLQKEMRKIRNVSKQKRQEYQMERFGGKDGCQKDLEPPDLDKR